MKKGFLTWEAMVKLIIAAIIIVFMVFAFSKCMSSLFGGNKDQAAIDGFRLLAYNVNSLISSGEEYGSSETIVYFPKGYYIIGFDKREDGHVTYRKPSKCYENNQPQACLCLYNDKPEPDNKDENILTCMVFQSEKEVVFLTEKDFISTNNIDSVFSSGLQRNDVDYGSAFPQDLTNNFDKQYQKYFQSKYYFLHLIGNDDLQYIPLYSDMAKADGKIIIYVARSTEPVYFFSLLFKDPAYGTVNEIRPLVMEKKINLCTFNQPITSPCICHRNADTSLNISDSGYCCVKDDKVIYHSTTTC
ncbi:hypothetical protein C4573_01270 [Candidatus Woesearchaeota archaeon]|nr:MAG: hypothetical protein C4573_01270 [Candidatus Woesearchaeota archaeon]